jgi:tetratricopeptide (TPR) repeat protein
VAYGDHSGHGHDHGHGHDYGHDFSGHRRIAQRRRAFLSRWHVLGLRIAKMALHKAHPRRAPMAERQALVDESPLAAPACLLLIILAACAAYHNSFSGPFVFDDIPAIVDNPSIRHLWPITRVMRPPLLSAGANGRPMVNLSLAVNYALGGTSVTGYHVVNLLLHVTVALVLFSLMLRTLRLPSLRGRFAGKARPIALAIALIWTVHPLLTESVTCVIQRNELIVGLFYLLTLYCVVRSCDSASKSFWSACAIAACLLGMASKEVMVTAPVMVLLYDRAFLSGSFKHSLRQRWRLYLGLAATWLLLGLLIFSHSDRNETVGFGHGVEWWAYALTQCQAIVRYLGLAVWPQGLVFDYGTNVVKTFATVWPQAGILLVLLGATVYATVRRPKLGFAGCWFFGILAPSSSIIPLTTQTVAEHRMYLPLIAVVAVAAVGLFAKASRNVGLALVVLVALALGWGTVQRNQVYQSAISLWSDTIRKRPDNARAYNDLGNALDAAGMRSEALANYDRALQLKPDYAKAYYNKADSLLKMGQASAAIELFDRALHITPDYFKALGGKADALVKAGQGDAAIPLYQEALKLQPDDAGVARSLGNALLGAGRDSEAIERFAAVLRVDAGDARAHSNLGYAYAKVGRVELAVLHFGAAVQLEPDSAEAHGNYAVALERVGRLSDAIGEYRQVIRLKPDDAVAYYTLGNACAQTGELLQAVAVYESALKYRPDYPEAHNNLGTVLRRLGRLAEAREHYRLALQYRPNYPQARRNLAALAGSEDASAIPEESR